MPTKRQSTILSSIGNDYSIKVIDHEPCIYKKLNDSYDIEISGTQRASGHMSVYVWDISNGENHSAKIVDRATGIKTISELKNKLMDFEKKYSR